MPLIADPGFKLVQACRADGHSVTIIPGANAALAALTGSGLPADSFYFAGFLPPKTGARRKAIEALAAVPSTLLFYEAPQRLAAALVDLETVFGPARQAAVARELTKLFEETKNAPLGELAAHYRARDARGEFVIIIAPPEKKAPVTQISTLDDLLKRHLRVHSLRDAVALISAATGAKKAEVYARALWLKEKTGQ
jgi:16S rRNA (cytidine1402-2'-O)-methyltransferase